MSKKELKTIDVKIANEYILSNDILESVKKFYPDKTSDAAYKYFERLSKNVEFISITENAKKTAAAKLGIDVEYILKTLKSWAESDITETINVSPDELKELPSEIRRLISSYKHSETQFDGGSKEVIELKFVSKEKALEMLTKHIGFYEIDNNQKKDEVLIIG